MADPAAGSPDRDDPSTFDASRVIQLLRVFLTAAKDDAPQQPDAHEDQGWETSGCTLWDLAALEHPAAVLAAAGGVPMLQLLATTMMERQQWRAAEISLGTLANLACHPEPRRDMAQSAALAEVAVQRALWADDPATVGEACRLASTVLSASHVRRAELRQRLCVCCYARGREADEGRSVHGQAG
jgi:phosphoketolase